MTKETIIFITIGAVFAMVALGGLYIGLMMLIRPKMLLRQRLRQIGVIGDGAASEKAESRRQKRIQEKVKQLGEKGRKKGSVEAISARLLEAGLDVSVPAYLVFSMIIAVIAPLIYLVLGFPVLGAIPVALVGGLLVPRLFLAYLAQRRQKKFTEKFADAIDLVVRGVRSGLPLNECFRVVAREFDAPLGDEFRLLVEGQNLGMTLDDLMAKGIERIPTSEYKFFAIVIQIQRQTGGNLADTLAGLSAVLRDRKKARDKAQAMASEAKASAAIIGSLPFAVGLILSVVNPDYIMLLFTDGQHLIAGGLGWMFIGTMVMKKMINFKV